MGSHCKAKFLETEGPSVYVSFQNIELQYRLIPLTHNTNLNPYHLLDIHKEIYSINNILIRLYVIYNETA